MYLKNNSLSVAVVIQWNHITVKFLETLLAEIIVGCYRVRAKEMEENKQKICVIF